MPQNNLSEQIKWLLKEKPFIPPALTLVAYDPEAQSHSSSFSEISSILVGPTTNDEPAPATATSIIQPTPPSSFSESRAPGGGTATNMARLRATLGDGRPQRRVAHIPLYDPSTTSASRDRDDSAKNDADDRRVDAAVKQLEPIHRARSRSPASRKKGMQNIDVAAIDLTTDNGEFSLLSPKSVSRGKKRKSDEFEEELLTRKSSGNNRSIVPIARGPSKSAEFTHIDGIADVPRSPPPPYSTTIHGSRGSITMQGHDEGYSDDDLGFRMSGDSGDENLSDAAPHTSEAICTSSAVSISPHNVGRQTQTPSPAMCGHRVSGSDSAKAKAGKARHTVMDSEEEDFGDLEEVEVDFASPLRAPYSSFHASRTLFAQESDEPPASQSRRSQILPLRSPAKVSRKASPPRPKNEIVSCIVQSRSRSQKSPKKHPSPKTPQEAPLESIAEKPFPSSFSKPEIKIVREVVEAFLDAEGFRLQQHLDYATSSWDKERASFTKIMVEFGQAQPEEKERMQQCRARKAAMEKLVALSSEHNELTSKREELKRKIAADLDAELYDSLDVDGEKARSISKILEEVQTHIYALLDAAGLGKYVQPPTEDGIGENAGTVVIRSTQATPSSKRGDTTISPSRNHVPQTQYIKQTQISVREVWTPSKRTRFAETSVKAPVAGTSRNSSPESAHRLIPEERLAPRGTERGHGVPETPRRRHSSDVRSQQVISRDFSESFDDGENLFGDHMGSPSFCLDKDENFCEDDDDDFLHEVVNIENQEPGGYDWKGDKVAIQSQKPSRDVFRETSTNRSRQQNFDSSPKRSQHNNGMNFPWSKDVKTALIEKFGLRGFRPGQLDAINATLNGEHCFVLMPTGGGKSLCYQLPSVITSGKTRGVTIVISPLLSLMEDQVEACRHRFNMQANLINGESTAEEKNHIMNGLREHDPQQFIQVLYVTPEMLSKNQRMINAFKDLHSRQRLARIVIDEAHCVSQWGHDFRPDYKALGEVMRQFPGVPIIALTATATQLVQTDVIANLGIRGCRKFSQSFNRPNLSYEVLEKGKGVVATIADLIKSKYPKKCGIVYCLSRKTCEQVAEKLTSLGVKAQHYHAGMESSERSEVQRQWQTNRYHVIVATIAFGMGIDKPDVRFVIHHSLPKSLEGYYQETGRAGRDGKRSGCYLFYLYGDCKVLKKMVEDGDGSREQKQRQHDMLRNVIQFCENRSDCRRALVLTYFSEQFRRENCHNTCDNCRSDARYEEKDLTKYAAAAVKMVGKVQDDNVTMLQCIDAFRGAKGSKLKNLDLEEFGHGEDLERGDVERLFHQLVEDRALWEKSKLNKAGFATNYLKLGPRSDDYANRRKHLKLQVRVTPRKPGPITQKSGKKRAADAAEQRTEYPSTYVSSPVRAPKQRSIRQYEYVQGDDEGFKKNVRRKRNDARQHYHNDFVVADDENDDDFEPIRVAKPSAAKRANVLGFPITNDERVAGLNDTQKMLLDEFMEEAKKLAKNILLTKGLRNQPFSDTILREMGLGLPENENEMLTIPGIDFDMVKHYGKRFLPLIKRCREFYGDNAPPSNISKRPIVGEDYDDDDDDDDQTPMDPNHQNVIDLVSSEAEEQMDEDTGDESLYGTDDFEGDEPLEVSHHFTPTSVDPRVEEYNRRASQLEASRMVATSSRGRSAPKAPVSKPGAKARALPWAKGGANRRKSSGGFRKSYSGVSKRGFAKKATARKGSSNFGATKPSGGGGRRGGGSGTGAGGAGAGGNGWSNMIAAMPT